MGQNCDNTALLDSLLAKLRCAILGLLTGSLPLIGLMTIVGSLSQAASGAESDVIEEILVTAQRRAQNSQDVPLSMTVLSGTDLQSLNIGSTGELGAHVPNLKVYNDSGENGAVQIVLRGVYSAGQTYMVGPSALVYSDDQLLDSYLSQGIAFFDAQRVEVLRGPQGTLFGRNATAGAVQVISNKSKDDSYATFTYGSFNQTRFEAAVGGEISDTAGIRVAGFYDVKDGWLENINTGEDIYDSDAYAVRGTLELAPSEDLDILVKVQRAVTDQHPLMWQNSLPNPHAFTDSGYDNALLFNPGPDSDYDKVNSNFSNGELEDSYEDTQLGLTVNWTLGEVRLTSITAYEEYEFSFLNDADSTGTSIFHFFNAVQYEGLNQELRLTSESDSAFQWIAGTFYQDAEMTSMVADDFTDLFIQYGIVEPGTGFGDMDLIDHESKSWALFVHTDYAWSDKLKTTHGIRYTRDKLSRVRTALNSSSFPRSSNLSFVNLSAHSDFGSDPLIVNHPDGEESDEVTWRLAAEYAVREDALLYASISTGYKAGTLGAFWNSLEGRFVFVEPETVVSYEVGVKSQSADGRLMINGAFFYYDYENYQSATNIGSTFSFSRSDINIPESKFVGFELELAAAPVDGLLMKLGVGYVNAEITEYVSNALEDLSGNTPPRTSDMDVNGLVRYEIPMASGTLSPQIDFSYVGKFYPDIENTANLGEFWRTNARLAYQHGDAGVSVNLFVENIGDEKELQNVFAPNDAYGLGTDIHTRDLGRTWGVSLRKEF